jgi:Acyl-CoA reductase (LuxC)
MERAFHLPGSPPVPTNAAAFAAGSLAVADFSGGDMRSLLQRLRAGAGDSTAAERSQAIAAAARRFLDPGDSLRRRAVAALPPVSGFSQAMVEDALPLVFTPLADAAALQRAAATRRPTVGLVGIVAAGNVLGVPLFKTALALAAGAACVVKPATGEPLLAALFAQALEESDPALAGAHAVVWWPGGSGGRRGCEDAFLSGVDSLIAYGSDDTIAALAARVRRFVGHGHKLSIGVVSLDRDGDVEQLAEGAARDISLYDQLGCLSPQSLYTVGGDPRRRAAFIDRLAAALGDVARRWPPGDVPEPHALAVRRLRDEYEWRELQGERVSLRAGADGGWTLIDDPTCGFRPSPLHRTIFVRHLDALEAWAEALGKWLPRVECVGMGPEVDRAPSVVGIPRLAALGCMQSPDLDWRQGGLEPMAGIIAEETS